jgi:hypothetical protein
MTRTTRSCSPVLASGAQRGPHLTRAIRHTLTLSLLLRPPLIFPRRLASDIVSRTTSPTLSGCKSGRPSPWQDLGRLIQRESPSTAFIGSAHSSSAVVLDLVHRQRVPSNPYPRRLLRLALLSRCNHSPRTALLAASSFHIKARIQSLTLSRAHISLLAVPLNQLYTPHVSRVPPGHPILPWSR